MARWCDETYRIDSLIRRVEALECFVYAEPEGRAADIRRFLVLRDDEVSAEGVQFSDGSVAIRQAPVTQLWTSMREYVDSPVGDVVIRWVD